MRRTRSAPWARASKNWYGLDHEVLAQHRDVDGGAHGVEIGERPAEPALLGEHRDRGRSPVGVLRGERGRIGDLRERALARAGALHLGDDGDAPRVAGGVERGERVACGRCGVGVTRDVGEAASAHALGEVVSHPGDDRVENSGHGRIQSA